MTIATLTPQTVCAQENSRKNTAQIESSSELPTYGGTLVLGTSNPPTIINPILTTYSVSASIISLLFNGLVRVNAEGGVEPSLAQSWDVSDDGLIYTFHLNKGIKFHDGVECTAYDVQFTYDQILDPNTKSGYRSHFDLVDRFEAVDDYTFRIILKKPFEPLLYKLVRYIIPKHLYKNTELENNSLNYKPVGTGPFHFQSWDEKTSEIKLRANEEYFEGRPYLDEVIIKTYPNISFLWSAFMRQEVDLIKYINRGDYELLEKDPTFETYKIPWESFYAIEYNLDDPVLSDRKIRQAIAMGIDKQEIISAVLGEAFECVGPFHPNSREFNKEVKPIAYDAVKAKLELMHRGWTDSDKDGVLEKGGKEFTLSLLVDKKNTVSRRIASLIRQHLAELGIKLNIHLYNDDSELTSEYLKRHNAQARLRLYMGTGNDKGVPIDSWSSLSTQSGKLWSYKNEEVDSLFDLAKQTLNDEERVQIYHKIHKLIYSDQPVCFLFFPVSFHAVSNRFHNTEQYFTYQMPTYTIKNWFVSEN